MAVIVIAIFALVLVGITHPSPQIPFGAAFPGSLLSFLALGIPLTLWFAMRRWTPQNRAALRRWIDALRMRYF